MKRGVEKSIKTYFYQNDTLQSLSITRNTDGDIWRQIWKYNDHSDPIEYTELTKRKEDTTFKIIEKEGYKYEYAKDGVQSKEYHTKDFKNYNLATERNIKYKDGQKIISIRQYNASNVLEFETTKTYHPDGELISETHKSIYGEYGKLYEQPRVLEQLTYRRIYTSY